MGALRNEYVAQFREKSRRICLSAPKERNSLVQQTSPIHRAQATVFLSRILIEVAHATAVKMITVILVKVYFGVFKRKPL